MSANVLMDKVADHYDQNPEFASALNRFVPGFEYPDWSYRTIGEVIAEMGKTHLSPWVGVNTVADSLGIEVPLEHRHYSEQVIHNLRETHGWTVFADNRVVQKDFGGELLFAHFDDRGRYLNLDRGLAHEDVVFNMDCRGVDVGVMAAIFNQKAEAMHLVGKLKALIAIAPTSAFEDVDIAKIAKVAYSRIEARDMAYGDAESALKLVFWLASGVKPDLQSVHKTVVEVLSPNMAGLWAEVDVVDFFKSSIHLDEINVARQVDAALCIAANMERNAVYKAAVVEFAPEVADEVRKIYLAEQEKIVAKEARKSAECAEMRWQVVPPSQIGGMVGLMDRQDGKDMVIYFGGVPAIQNFAKENPDVPVRVINELLGRDGGYVVPYYPADLASLHPFPCLEHSSGPGYIVRDTIDACWEAAAVNAVLAHSFRNAEMIADTKGTYELVDKSTCVDLDKTLHHTGKILGVTDKHVVLSLGRAALIYVQADLDRVPVKDELVSIAFTAGKGVVSPPVPEKCVDNGR